jgi:mono/diheme cytochrome c family protein
VPLGIRHAVLLGSVALGFAQDYATDIQPIFRSKCSGCHGAAMQSNGLRLDNGADALKGGYSGPAIVKGKSAESKLIERVTSTKDGFRMPPAGPRLSESDVAKLRSWIDAGANVPAGSAATTAAPAAPKTDLWSFQPVKRPPLPIAGKSAIDSFIAARLRSEGIASSPEADRVTLLRRVTLDLTGLPPTPTEIADFLADRSPEAYERQVDRLLRSPHYGERWARQWLDMAHYADSDGYEKDQARAWAWRYRHWLIDALNRDLPYDRFTIEQLAGDMLPARTVDTIVATGFLRNTLTNREAGVDREEARFEQLVNRTNTVATTWLGLTMGCAQCHDHKYDPVSQRDYYRLLSFFERTEEAEMNAPLPGELGPYLAALPEYEKKRAALLAEYEVPTLQPLWEAKIMSAIDDAGKAPEWDFALTSMKAMFDRTVRVMKTPPAERSARDRRRLTDYFVFSNNTTLGLDKNKIDKLKELRKKLNELDATLPLISQAPVMTDDPATPPTPIRVRGDWKSKGITVDSGVPLALPQIKPASGSAASRLDLARTLVSRDNPLTARVWVNRAWQEFFGRGLVKTAEDFGKQGEKPSHPALLDWLAAEFMERGWSMKHLYKTIVMSATYRQSSAVRADVASKDPENVLLARQSRVRLPAEALRDQALAVSGLLNDSIGGRSIRPPQPAGVAELGYGGRKWEVTTGRDRYRRGLYIHFQRTTPHPMLMNFDAPDMSVTCTRRSRSNTPLQALNLLNDEVFFEAAKALAWRVEEEASGQSLSGKIDYAFRLCLGRNPSAKEHARLEDYYQQQATLFEQEKQPLAAMVGVSRVLLNLDEFITRE